MLYERFSNSYYILTSLIIIIYNALFYLIVQPFIVLIGYHIRTDEIKVIA